MDDTGWKDPFFAAGATGPGGGGAPGMGAPGAGAHGAAGAAGSPRIRVVAVDLDGVVWLAGTVLPDAGPALKEVVRRGFDLRYVTNNSTAHREAVAERLAAAGLPAGVERVLTSGYVTGQWLRQRLPQGAPVLVVGEAGLLRELTEAGLTPFHAGDPSPGAPAPAAVVVGMDRNFSFRALAQAQAAILAGSLFIGTNPDATFPTPTGLLPGAGSIVTAVATAAQKEPVYMGKPGLGLAEILASVTGVGAGQTLFIGDRMSTDIGMGIRAGMVTVLVLTGITTPREWQRMESIGGPNMPDHVLHTLAELPPLLDKLSV